MAVELYTHATAETGLKFDNDYCWIWRFDDDKIIEVCAYLDSALVASVIRQCED